MTIISLIQWDPNYTNSRNKTSFHFLTQLSEIFWNCIDKHFFWPMTVKKIKITAPFSSSLDALVPCQLLLINNKRSYFVNHVVYEKTF